MSWHGNKVDSKHGGTHRRRPQHSEIERELLSSFSCNSDVQTINNKSEQKSVIQDGESAKNLFSTSDTINISRNLNLCGTNIDLVLVNTPIIDERKRDLILDNDDSLRIDEHSFSPKSLSVQSLDKIFDWQNSTLPNTTQDTVIACLEELERGSQLSQEEKEMLENSKKELHALELREDRNNTLMTPQELENMPEQGIEFEESVGPKDVADSLDNIPCITIDGLMSDVPESLPKSQKSNSLVNLADNGNISKLDLDSSLTTMSVGSSNSNVAHIFIDTVEGKKLFQITLTADNAESNQDSQGNSRLPAEENNDLETQGLILVPTSKPGEFIVSENMPALNTSNSPLATIANPLNTGKHQEWICPVFGCNKVFKKQCKLKVHMMSHAKERPFKCDFNDCDWSFISAYKLKRHLESHTGRKCFECPINGCRRKFTTIYNLNSHKRLHNRPNIAVCSVESCNMKFPTKRQLDIHLKQHEGIQAPYKCTFEGCLRVFYLANSLASHLRKHARREEDFKCPIEGCGKVFDRSCRLRIHIWQHTGERPYVCDVEGCTWTFTSLSKLTRHMRKHTGERNFFCTEKGCGKYFRRQEHLKGHMISHSGIKPFQCTYENCKANFTARSSLYVHSKKHVSSGEKIVYHCPFDDCEKKYNSKPSLKTHVLKRHTTTTTILSDSAQLDYITLLSNDFSEMTDIEMLTKAPDDSSPTILSVSSVGSVDASIPFSQQDSSLASPSDFAATVDPHLVPPSAFDSDVITQHVGNNVVTQFVINDDLPSPHSITNRLTAESGVLSFSTDLGPASGVFHDSGTGSARTDSHSNHVLSDRARKRRLLQQQAKLGFTDVDSCPKPDSPSKFCMSNLRPTDVVLTSSAITFRDPATGTHYVQTQLLQDDPPNPDIYQDDTLLATSAQPNLSILQESQAVEQNSEFVNNGEFTGTTINLQDLE